MALASLYTARQIARRWIGQQTARRHNRLSDKRRAEIQNMRTTEEFYPAIARDIWLNYDHAKALAMNEHFDALQRFLASETDRFNEIVRQDLTPPRLTT